MLKKQKNFYGVSLEQCKKIDQIKLIKVLIKHGFTNKNSVEEQQREILKVRNDCFEYQKRFDSGIIRMCWHFGKFDLDCWTGFQAWGTTMREDLEDMEKAITELEQIMQEDIYTEVVDNRHLKLDKIGRVRKD